MVILSATNISKSYGVTTILTNISFHVNHGDKIGIIGDNGAGKTTLLSILSGELASDSGEFYLSSDTVVGVLKQKDNFSSRLTVQEEMLGLFAETIAIEQTLKDLSHEIAERSSHGEDVEALLHQYDDLSETFSRKRGYTYKSEIKGILTVMAFPDDYLDKPVSLLSGGERTRLALACLLLRKPDLLLLDEPTNHLDIGTLKWLEQFLKSYEGTVILISHDRYFLDQVATRIFEVENHALVAYDGNYTAFREKKAQRQADAIRHYEQQKKEIERQEEIIRRFKQHGTEKLAKRAKSREHRLQQTDHLDRPSHHKDRMKLHFKERFQSGTDVLFAKDLSKSFPLSSGEGERLLFQGVDFDLKRGERICLVGPNGIGKTTLLKMMMGLVPVENGEIRLGHNVEFAYYDQEQHLLEDSHTVLEELHSDYRLYTETELRSILGRFLFRNDDVFKQVGALSGGEKGRLTLLKLMLTGANFLLLDEPTNHLDLSAKEVFEDALLEFGGTIFIVSHDRYLLNKVPTRIFELTENGIESYLGGYDYYMEKKQGISSAKNYLQDLGKRTGGPENDRLAIEREEAQTLREKKLEDRRKSKEEDARRRKIERDLASVEASIALLEEEISVIEAEMCKESVFSDHQLMLEFSKNLEEKKKQLASSYDQWLELQ